MRKKKLKSRHYVSVFSPAINIIISYTYYFVINIFLVTEILFYLAYLCLEQLENENQELFDWMCSRLDNGGCLIRRDYERLAAKYKLISPEERNALHDELQSKGSPSRMLMSLVQTMYPNLPLTDFVKSLKEIRRNDIAQKLMPYVRYNDTSNSLAH